LKRSLVDAFINTLAVILIVLALNQSLKIFLAGHWLSASGSMAFYLLLLILFLLRKPSKEALTRPGHFLVAMGGTFLTLGIQFNPDPNPTLVGISLPFELAGAVFSVMALASLGRGFGVVAANREIKTHGLYQFIRHPLYTGEALWFFSLILQNLSPWNAILFLTQIGCQILRMRDEESLLRKDPVYAAYLEQVRYRMIPGLF
jgi:protein-S-isoprenylcysteine O-methyltransferase Ste14